MRKALQKIFNADSPPIPRQHSFSVIYQITNRVNGKIYVGSSKKFSDRFSEYRKFDNSLRPLRRPIEAAIRKYGFGAFDFIILEIVFNVEDLIPAEQRWIDSLMPFHPNGYNVNRTAGSRLGMRHTDESKRKIRQNANPAPWDKERRIRHSMLMTGFHHRADSILKMKRIGKKNASRVRAQFSKPVCQFDLSGKFVGEFSSATNAAKAVNGISSSIGMCCRLRSPTAYGFQWRWKEDYERIGFIERKRKQWRSIIQMDESGETIRIWRSLGQIKREMGWDKTAISLCCNGDKYRIRSYGYKWKWGDLEMQSSEAKIVI